MSTALRSHGKKTVYWLLLAVMVLGLGGFGVGNFGGSMRAIGSVGKTEVGVTDFILALQTEMRAVSAQLGQPVTTQMAKDFGLDRAVQARLFANAALDEQNRALGVSVGDEEVRRQILTARAFQGPSGKFDRETYTAALRQQGQTETQFESKLRAESARLILQGAVVGGVAAPAVAVERYTDFITQTRSFSWLELTEAGLTAPLSAPTPADLEAYYKAHPAEFTLPETRKISYAYVTPEMIVDSVSLDEAALKAAYEARADEFNQPEKRLVERLVYPSVAEAEAAKASGKSFADLAAERGLTLADADLGEVEKADLGAAGEAVFALTEAGIVGPIETDLGPALFSMNAILEAKITSFEEAKEELAGEAKMDRARRMIADMSGGFEDDLAGGVTLEEIAEATDLEFGQIDFTPETSEGIAGYEAFRVQALKVTEADFPELGALDDGGVFALRLDAVVAPALQPLEVVRAQVEAGWRAEALTAALSAQGAALAAGAAPLAGAKEVAKLARGGFVEGLAGEAVAEVFALKSAGDGAVVTGSGEFWGRVFVVRLGAIEAASAQAEAETRAQVEEQLTQGIATDLFDYYARALEAEAGVVIDATALNAALTQMQ